jgi:hypothetical protein
VDLEEFWAEQADALHAYEANIPVGEADRLIGALDAEIECEEILAGLEVLV